MALTLSRIDRIEVEYDVAAFLPDGTPDPVTALDVAVVPPRSGVNGDTQWTTLPVVDGVLTVTYAAPEADDVTAALAVPAGGADAHAREVDGPLVKAVKFDRVSVS